MFKTHRINQTIDLLIKNNPKRGDALRIAHSRLLKWRQEPSFSFEEFWQDVIWALPRRYDDRAVSETLSLAH